MDDFEQLARKFAGLALGTSWRNTEGREVRIKRAFVGGNKGSEEVILQFDTGEQAARDFLTEVQAGRYEPLSADADAAYILARPDSSEELDGESA
jgi:hypothetical protein